MLRIYFDTHEIASQVSESHYSGPAGVAQPATQILQGVIETRSVCPEQDRISDACIPMSLSLKESI